MKRLALLAVVMIAFGLRAYRIDSQSLWYDEGVSAVMAQRDLSSIIVNAAADIHPPLYYVLLSWWVKFVGLSELSLRWPSLMSGVLLVCLILKLAERMFGSRAGLAAMLLAAVAPFTIYYSQEARMYMQVAFLGALSTYLAALLLADICFSDLSRRSLIQGALYIAVTIALVYTHYFSFTLLLVHDIWLVAMLCATRDSLRHKIKKALMWTAAQLIVLLTFVPWLYLSLPQLRGWPSISDPFTLAELLRRVFLVFTFGLSWDAAATTKKELLFLAILAGVLLAPLLDRQRAGLPNVANSPDRTGTFEMSADQSLRYLSGPWLAMLLAISYALVPILALYMLSLQRPMYNPKFLLLATPAYFVLLGLGAVSLGRLLAAVLSRVRSLVPLANHISLALTLVLIVAAVFATSRSTLAYYFDPKYSRDDYRGVARYIQIQAKPDDAVILNAPGQVEIFGYYFRGKQAVFPLPQERPMDEARTEAALQEIAGKHSGIWLVLWAQVESDPNGFVERWLDENGFRVSSRWFGAIRLVHYVVRGSGAGWQEEPRVTFGESILLKSIRVGATMARPGDVVDITLTWQAVAPIAERYTVFLHVIDDDDYLWGQTDSEPGGGKKITSSWAPGQDVEDRHGVPILVGTPPGRYRFEIGLYDHLTGRRLPIKDGRGEIIGDRLLFGELDVAKATDRPDLQSLDITHRSELTFADNLKLLGFDFHRLGESTSATDFRSGDIALATIFWKADGDVTRDYVLSLEVLDSNGRLRIQQMSEPANGRYPTSQWKDGELIRDQHKVPLRDLAPGDYVLRLRVAAERSDELKGSESGGQASDVDLLRFHIR